MTNEQKAKKQRERRKKYTSAQKKKIAKQVKAYAEKHKEKLSFLKSEQYKKSKNFILNYKLSHPCVDCGESDPAVLDFDHIDPKQKTETIANMLGRTASLEKISKEIEKCEVRCANCHRKKHYYNKYNKPLNIVLIGGGNHVRYTIDIIKKDKKYNIVGIIDSKQDIGCFLYGYQIIGRQENIKQLIEQYKIQGGIISIGDNWSRKLVYEDIIKNVPDFTFVNAIHPSCEIGERVFFGRGIIAMAGCIFNPGACIGDFTFFATGAQIEHDCVIGLGASVSAGSVLGGHVFIGKYSAVTLGCTVLDRINIGENTVVGSGSLVTKDLPDNVLAYGSPAKIIRTREIGEKFLK